MDKNEAKAKGYKLVKGDNDNPVDSCVDTLRGQIAMGMALAVGHGTSTKITLIFNDHADHFGVAIAHTMMDGTKIPKEATEAVLDEADARFSTTAGRA